VRSEAEPGRPYALIHDGGCAVCGRLVRLVERWDRRALIETIPSGRPDLAARFPWLTAAECDRAMQLVGPGGETWSGGAAVERLLKLLPHGWLAGWIFRLPMGGRAAERVYRWFARNRYRFGCSEHCQLTAAALPAHHSGTSPGSPRGSS
jgi:predicted DCC family thiol-disulfide oxidoreductase YuxK